MMKTLVLLLTVVASVAPHGTQHIVYPNNDRTPIGAGPDGILYQGACKPLKQKVYAVNNRKAYHFSWCYDGGRKYDWQQANAYCQNLGDGWLGVSIESREENYFLTSIIENHRLPYIWTSGNLRYQKPSYHSQAKDIWVWVSTGRPFNYYNWGKTGEHGLPQPDNNENNNERCMGILNHFYKGDTTTWHDIGCHHMKPIICERGVTPNYSG